MGGSFWTNHDEILLWVALHLVKAQEAQEMHICPKTRGSQNSNVNTVGWNNICHQARLHFCKLLRRMRLISLTVYNVLYSPLSVVYVHSIFSVFIFILFILYQEAKDIDCWPCLPFDIFLLVSLLASMRPECTADALAGNILHQTYPLEYQNCSSQPRQKLCWASSLRI
jgi:hypothetical protein